MNSKIDTYLAEGCGRCELVGTPECKVHSWTGELELLRKIALDCGLDETLKWSVPCYTYKSKNIAIISAFKAYCALSFFKGSLLKDSHNILVRQTKNVQGTRQARFTSTNEITQIEPILKAYFHEAIEVEKAGLKIGYKKVTDFEMPEELRKKLAESPALKAAFEALTPGRQKGYLLYFSGAKQAKTREARIEKYTQHILKGKGFHDR